MPDRLILSGAAAKPVIVFDLNETLLDLSALDPTFARIFATGNGAELRTAWFRQVLELFLTATVIDDYRSFDELTADALQMLVVQRGKSPDRRDGALLKEALGGIPAYPDVRPGLDRLREAGFTVATLTNSTKQSAERLLESAGLRPLFDHVLSADDVRRYKPAREAYEYAARQLDVGLDEIVLVAAHAWDIAGAMSAGCMAAFVERPQKALSPAAKQPEFSADGIEALAEQLVARYS